MALDLKYWNSLASQLGWGGDITGAPAYNHSPNDSNPRERGYVHYFIIHHTATTNEALVVDLMQPGGRTVTAQWILCTDGKFRPNIVLDRRAYTSSSWLDDIADTVETVNVTAGPAWIISDLSKLALAYMAVWKFRNGRLRALNRSYIVGHSEVLAISGSGYVTMCPGPNMQLDLIVELANEIQAGLIGPPKPEPDPEPIEEDEMAIRQIHYIQPDKNILRAQFSESSGFFSELVENNAGSYNTMVQQWDTGGSVSTSKTLYDSIKAACAAVRAGT